MADRTRKEDALLDNPTMASWRIDMGFTQREAAEALGCARNSVQNWERDPATLPHYIKLAMRALGTGISAGPPPKPSDFDDIPECIS